jgi:hypothetical protein
MISTFYNIIFIRSVSSYDRFQNMVLRISQHCTLCTRSWFLCSDLGHGSCGCRQSNAFVRRSSFPPFMESVVLLCTQASQWMVGLGCLIFEYRILPQAPELLSVENRKEKFFPRFTVYIVHRH